MKVKKIDKLSKEPTGLKIWNLKNLWKIPETERAEIKMTKNEEIKSKSKMKIVFSFLKLLMIKK
jgi:hypothetical protein